MQDLVDAANERHFITTAPECWRTEKMKVERKIVIYTYVANHG